MTGGPNGAGNGTGRSVPGSGAGRARLRLRPTALGVKAILFYILLVGAFYAATYANLFFLLIVFLTALGAANFGWAVRNLAGAHAAFDTLEPVPAGAGGPLSLRVEPGSRTRAALVGEITLADGSRIRVPVSVVRGPTVVTGGVPPLPRGLHRVVHARLLSDWPLGLLRASRRIPAPEVLVVFPAPAEPEAARGGEGGLDELLGECRPRDGALQPSGVREYVAGDELRRIHWRASARRGTLAVKEWEGGGGSGVEVVLDRRCSAEEFERALSVLSALALAARRQKEPLTLVTQGVSATWGPEHKPWRELLTLLAGAEALPPNGPPPPPVSPGILRLPAGIRGGAR